MRVTFHRLQSASSTSRSMQLYELQATEHVVTPMAHGSHHRTACIATRWRAGLHRACSTPLQMHTPSSTGLSEHPHRQHCNAGACGPTALFSHSPGAACASSRLAARKQLSSTACAHFLVLLREACKHGRASISSRLTANNCWQVNGSVLKHVSGPWNRQSCWRDTHNEWRREAQYTRHLRAVHVL